MKKIGFILPWYGLKIPGGAEAEARETVEHLHQAGFEAEVLTTCVKEFHSDWNRNYHKPGLEHIQGIPVRRFRVRKRDRKAFDRINAKLLHGLPVTEPEEIIFMREMIHSPDLTEYVLSHKAEYEIFICMPYMFGTTYDIIKACPEKSVLLPCFHDEPYFYLRCYQECYAKAAGMIFNSRPEQELTAHYYDLSRIRSEIIGIGMNTDIIFDADQFRQKFGISERFLLYAGRKDSGKNTDLLIRYFQEYKKRNASDLKLVMIGDETHVSGSDMIDLGFISAKDKYHALAASEFLCQPSRNESFSLVIMESWLCGRPVLVNGDCPVTKAFVCDADGGLYFRDYLEFEGCIRYFLHHPDVSAVMGQNGGNYVRKHFSWSRIIEKYQKFFERGSEEFEADHSDSML